MTTYYIGLSITAR